MTISWNEPVKVAFEFRIVDSRAAVVLWSSSVTAPNAWCTIREAIKHQDDIQMDRRHRFIQYWRNRNPDHAGTKVG